MTSKNLFSRLLKEDLKRRLWTIALSVLMFFLALPIYNALSIGEEGIYNTPGSIVYRLTQNLASNNILLMLITIVGAVVCGLSSFYYLHSKKKVDLYHSIPVKREKLFAINFMNGLFIYIVPYLINLLITFLIIQVNGYMNLEIIRIAIISVGVNFVFYTLIYTLTVIAVMLTGNIVISFFGTGVFLSYGPLLMIVKELYYSVFLKHFPNTRSEQDLFLFLSPIGKYVRLAKVQIEFSINSYVAILQEGLGIGILKTVIVILVFIAFALFLFIKRPSEAAGKSMSFTVSKPIIKFLLVIPLTLLGGTFFKQIANSSGTIGWFVFGLLFTFIVISAIIEIMFNFDIRTAFHHKRHLLVCALVVGIISSIFQFDLFKYDSYLPSKEKIDYMSVYFDGFNNNGNYINLDKDNTVRYINDIDYHLDNVRLKDFNAAYALAKIGIDEEPDSEVSNVGNTMYNYRVKYVLKNGKEVERNYELEANKNMDLLSAIYDNKEYKEVHHQIYQFQPADIISITCSSQNSTKNLTLDEEEEQELLNVYKGELAALKLEDFNNIQQATSLVLSFNNNQSADYEVYSNFTETIKFLQSHGFDDFDTISVDNVNEVVVSYYGSVYTEKEEILSYAKGNSDKIYTDKKVIEEILSNIVDADIYWQNFSVMDKEEYFDIFLSTSGDGYNGKGSNFFFRKDRIPEVIKKDFGIKD